jgi:hypothetical protein
MGDKRQGYFDQSICRRRPMVFAASGAEEESLESDTLKHFAYFLVDTDFALGPDASAGGAP